MGRGRKSWRGTECRGRRRIHQRLLFMFGRHDAHVYCRSLGWIRSLFKRLRLTEYRFRRWRGTVGQFRRILWDL
jgi:hypothetical protein